MNKLWKLPQNRACEMIYVYQLERDHTIDMKWNMKQQHIHTNETEGKTMLDNHTTGIPRNSCKSSIKTGQILIQ